MDRKYRYFASQCGVMLEMMGRRSSEVQRAWTGKRVETIVGIHSAWKQMRLD